MLQLKKVGLILVFCGCIITSCGQIKVALLRPIDEGLVLILMGFLADTPARFGRPINDRSVWDSLRRSGKYDRFLKQMVDFHFPAFSESDYFSLSNGTATSSAKGLEMMRNRARGLLQATLAACLKNENKYIKVVEAGLRDILKQPSWVSPRND